MAIKTTSFDDLVDRRGFLCNHKDWSEDFVQYVIGDDGVSLSRDCWSVLRVIRKYYKENNRIPKMHTLSGLVSLPAPMIIRIFPYFNDKRQEGVASYEYICRLAGMTFSAVCAI